MASNEHRTKNEKAEKEKEKQAHAIVPKMVWFSEKFQSQIIVPPPVVAVDYAMEVVDH